MSVKTPGARSELVLCGCCQIKAQRGRVGVLRSHLTRLQPGTKAASAFEVPPTPTTTGTIRAGSTAFYCGPEKAAKAAKMRRWRAIVLQKIQAASPQITHREEKRLRAQTEGVEQVQLAPAL
uniref:Uncharacterized protein n=1 Tax=Knipowitschia caucasica TaxID=637954 RepID=A0AAV2JIQ7_KNICA